MTQTRLGIPVDFSNEGIRGLAHYKTTNFPVQLGLGATWDPELIHRVGQVTGREARALGYTNVYSPVVDLARDPRWGRVMDCYGEDPYHVGESLSLSATVTSNSDGDSNRLCMQRQLYLHNLSYQPS